jgi:uncharacterized protein involved in outer membrane biogenesis
MSRIAIMLLASVGVLFFCVGVAVVGLPYIDLHRIVAERVSAALGRDVTIRTAHLVLGDPITIELQDAVVANAATDAGPDLGRLKHLTVELDPWKILRGRLTFRRVTIDGLVIGLARGTDGTGNWRSPVLTNPSTSVSLRARVPTILDIELTNARLTMLTSGGQLLRITATSLSMHTTGDDASIIVAVEGSYNDTAVRLDAALQSFLRLRDAARPFGVMIKATAAETILTFEGTVNDPLHADSVVGVVRADLARLDTLLAVAAVPLHVNVPMTLTSPMTRQGDQWTLSSITGKFAGAAYLGHAELAEGSRAQPDKLGITLDIAQLKADTLLRATSAADGKVFDVSATALRVNPAPGLLLDARLRTRQLRWRSTDAGELRLHLVIAPARISVVETALALAGGGIAGAAEAVPAGQGAAVVSHIDIAGPDIGSLLRMAGIDVGGTSGRVHGRANLTLRGATFGEAVATAQGQTVLTISEGQVARQLIHIASGDLGLLFAPTTGVTPILCFLAVADVRDGSAAVSPLRLRTRDGTLVGGGRINLRGGTLDMTAKTLPATTGILSLDLPIQISGRLLKPSVRPSSNSVANARLAQGAANLRLLPPDLAPLALQNGCAR